MDHNLKFGIHCKSKSFERRSKTEMSLGSAFGDDSMKKMMVVGKGLSMTKSRTMASGYHIHECHSDTSVNPLSSSPQHKDSFPTEGLILAISENPSASTISFASALSDFSSSGYLQKKLNDMENEISGKDATISFLKKQLNLNGDQNIEFSSVAVETDAMNEDVQTKLSELHGKLIKNEETVFEISRELLEVKGIKDKLAEENQILAQEINVLNNKISQIESKTNGNDLVELSKVRELMTELEKDVITKGCAIDELQEHLRNKDSELEEKEKLLAETSKNYQEYQESSSTEIKKLLYQVSHFEKCAREQEKIYNCKISEAQKSMQDEIASLTEKIEIQYKEEFKAAVNRCRISFKRLSELPKNRLEKIMKLIESGEFDYVVLHKDLEDQKMLLEKKIILMEEEKKKEINCLVDTYESKISSLKSEMESLSQQLKERKETLDTFETELKMYRKERSKERESKQGNLNINELKKLHVAEIQSEQEKHILEKKLLQDKIQKLCEEISSQTMTEKIHYQELQSAKLKASAFRNKYETLLNELEEKVNSKNVSDYNALIEELDLENYLNQFKSLISSIKNVEEIQADKIKNLKKLDEDEASIHEREILLFKSKLQQVDRFQARLLELDNEVKQLINTVSEKYESTVDSLSVCYNSELKCKSLEIDSIELEKADELNELRTVIKKLEEGNQRLEKEIHSVKISYDMEICCLKRQAEELAVELLRNEGILAMKSEIEETLTKRINYLESVISVKNDGKQKDLESALSKCMTLEALVSAKDEIAMEYEDKIKASQKILSRSNEQIIDTEEHCLKLEESFKKLEDMTQLIIDMINCENYVMLRKKLDRLGAEFDEVFVKSKDLENKCHYLSESNSSLVSEKRELVMKHEEMKIEKDKIYESYKLIEEEMRKVEERSKNFESELNKVKKEKQMIEAKCNDMMVKNLDCETDKNVLKIIDEIELDESAFGNEIKYQRLDLATRWVGEKEEEWSLKEERDEALMKNNLLRDNIKVLSERVDFLLSELSRSKTGGSGKEDIPGTGSLSDSDESFKANSSDNLKYFVECDELSKENQDLKRENERFKMELKETEMEIGSGFEGREFKGFFKEKMVSKLESIQEQMCDIIKEKNSLIEDFGRVKKNRNRLKEEVEYLRGKLSMDFMESENSPNEMKINDMKEEIRRLMNHVKTLNFELDLTKKGNDILLTEARYQVKSNQCLKDELEEARSQKFEIEDQLAKLRRENTMLNLHRDQLEQTNKKISNLLSEGTPSVVSWIKIHETVENIVDVVQAMKTSFAEPDTTKMEQFRSKSDFKNLPDALHLELEQKTQLCQDLISQKVMLEKELKSLETIMNESKTRCCGSQQGESMCMSASDFSPDMLITLTEERIKVLNPEEDQPYLATLHNLKKEFETQAHLQEAQLTKALANEIKGLKKEMRLPDGEEGGMNVNENSNIDALNEEYREKIDEINRGHEMELEKLREILREMKETGNNSLLIQEIESKHGEQMEELRKYFEKKCADLEKNFCEEVFSQHSQKDPEETGDDIEEAEIAEKEDLVEKYRLLLDDCKCDDNAKQIFLEYITDIVSSHTQELDCLTDKYRKHIDNLRKRYSLELDKIREELEQVKKNAEGERELLVKNHENRLKEIVIEERRMIAAELEKEFETKVRREIKNLSELLQAEWKAQEEECANLEDSCLEKMSIYQTELALKKIETEKELESRITRKNEERFKKELEEEKKKIAEYYKDLNEAAFKRFNMEQENLIKSHSEVMHRLILEHENKISELKKAHQRDLEKFHCDKELKLAMEFRSREKKFEKELSCIKSTYEDELLEFKKCCQDALNEQVTLAKTDAYNTLQKQIQDYLNGDDEHSLASKEVIELGEKFAGKYRREIEELKQLHQGEVTRIRTEYEEKIRSRFSTGSLPKKSFEKMELRTDDDKLKILRERDALQEMVSSLRHVLSELIRYVGNCEDELNNTLVNEFGKNEETFYKSFHIDTSVLNETDCSSLMSRKVHFAPDLSGIISEINDSRSLNASIQVRMELDKCLKQLKSDAYHLLALSNPGKKQDKTFYELLRELEEQRNLLAEKVVRVEEMQKDLRVDFSKTKNKLEELERTRETVSEGFGEVIVDPQKQENMLKLKEKAKELMRQQSSLPSDILHVLDEMCKEGDRLEEEAKREKNDLQLQGGLSLSGTMSKQVDAADKQLRATRKFLEEQAMERESERDDYLNEIKKLKEALKVRERDKSLHDRMNQEFKPEQRRNQSRLETLENQLRDANGRLTELEQGKTESENQLKEAVDKVWTLRDIIRDLEGQVATLSEQKSVLLCKIEELENAIENQEKFNNDLMIELDNVRARTREECAEHIKDLEEELAVLRRAAERLCPEAVSQMKMNLREIELALVKKTKDLEQLHASSANVSCSSSSVDISIFERLDATRCPTPDEMQIPDEVQKMSLPLEDIDRINEKLLRHTRAEEVALKTVRDLQMQLKNNRKAYEEIQIERDVLLERTDNYLQENSRLKVRLDEQRCNAGLIQKQASADLEAQIKRLEFDIEKLKGLCIQKDKQIRDMNTILEQTTKSLKIREAEALNKSNEENEMITNLKTELHNALDEKKKVEESMSKMKETLRETVTVPFLIDSMLEEKNAEIDRLEKEVARLSKPRAASSLIKSQLSTDFNNSSKSLKRVKFSEPDSFVQFVSPILPEDQSVIRCGSDSYFDLKISSYKLKKPVLGTTPESLSSIGALQLSPRGIDSHLHWTGQELLMSSPKENTSIEEVESLHRQLSEQTEKIKKYESELSERSSMDAEIDEIKVQLKSTLDAVEQDKSTYKKEFEKMFENESKLRSELDSKKREVLENLLEIDTLKRKLAEINLELETQKSEYQKLENDLMAKEEEIRKLSSNSESLLITIETMKRNHLEKVEEMQNKLNFEHNRVESVLGELNILAVKKVEIEEEFLSLKDDYNEKLESQRRTVTNLRAEMSDLQQKNKELKKIYENLESQTSDTLIEADNRSKGLEGELSAVKNMNEKLKNDYISLKKDLENYMTKPDRAEIGVQALVETCEEMSQTDERLTLVRAEATEEVNDFQTNFDKLKSELSEWERKMEGRELNMEEALSYAALVRTLISCISENLEDHFFELQTYRRKIMECSVDDLTDKVQKELLLSAKLDSKLLSSLQTESSSVEENSGGDNNLSKKKQNLVNLTIKLYELETNLQDMEQRNKEFEAQIAAVRQERNKEKKRAEGLKVLVKMLENGLAKERAKLEEERSRYDEDAKIMEVLRVNFELFVEKAEELERALSAERQHRLSLEKLLKTPTDAPDAVPVSELKCQLEIERQKCVALGTSMEKEKKKNQELKIQLEQEKLERISDRDVQSLLNKDLALLQEQKDNLETQLAFTRKLLQTRQAEIVALKRKINLQEIDIKALTISNENQLEKETELSLMAEKLSELEKELDTYRRQLQNVNEKSENVSAPLLMKMKALDNCVQQQVQENNEMGEALFHLTQETEEMKNLIKKMEETNEMQIMLSNSSDDTIVADPEQKSWSSEREKLSKELEKAKCDYEILKKDSLEVFKSNDSLKLEIKKLNKEVEVLKEEIARADQRQIGIPEDRVLHLFGKYMRLKSYRKALAFQKLYLTSVLNGYEGSEEEVWARITRGRNGRRIKKKRSKRKRFKIIVLAIIAIKRIQFAAARWKFVRLTGLNVLLGQYDQPTANKENEFRRHSSSGLHGCQIDPLRCQTHNFLRQQQQQRAQANVLRTPPSRDTDSRSRPIDARRICENIERFNVLQKGLDLPSRPP